MTTITLEPARFAMTGSHPFHIGLQQGFWYEEVQAIDAPTLIAVGSVTAGHITRDGLVYAATTTWSRT